MERKHIVLVSLLMTALLIASIATPVQAVTWYSKDCDTVWVHDVMGIDPDQYYDSQDWNPGSNSSQCDRFWADDDDVSIPLTIYIENNHQGLQKTLTYKYIVDVDIDASGASTYTISEGEDSSFNEAYDNSIDLDYQESDNRTLTIDVTDVAYEGMITLMIWVKVFDGPAQIQEDYCYYWWVGAI